MTRVLDIAGIKVYADPRIPEGHVGIRHRDGRLEIIDNETLIARCHLDDELKPTDAFLDAMGIPRD